jgi:hypothetical protein
MKKAENEKAEKLLAELNEHPLTKKLREDKAAETLATRREVAGKIAALRNEESAVLPKLQADLQEKEAVHAAAKTVLAGAAAKVQAATLALRQARLTFETTIGNCEASLFESADPAIDEAITFFRDKLDFLRTPGRISRNAVGSERNIFTEKKTVKEESNVAAIKSAMAYCQAAITELENMKLAPAMDAERIAGLKAGIPKIDVYTEYTGEKPMEKVPPRIIPRFGDAGSDEYEQTLIDRLIKKANDFLSKPAIPKPATPASAKRAEPWKREAPAVPGPPPKPAKEMGLQDYQEYNRHLRAYLGGGSRWDSRR